MVDICKSNGAGILSYKWENPKTGLVEDKITYVFRFAPYDWIVGTGAYYSELNNQLIKEVSNITANLHYGDNGYFFIVDYNGRVLSHPFVAKGTDVSNLKDLQGNLVVTPLVEIARKEGEGFYSYGWKKSDQDDYYYEKLSFARDFPAWNLVIGTGIYIDDIQKEMNQRKQALLEQLRELVKSTKINLSGYFFIFDENGKVIIHPDSQREGKIVTTLNPKTEQPIISDLINAAHGSGKLTYLWDKPDEPGNYIYKKEAWIEYIPELKWYVATSVYTDEVKETSQQLKRSIIIIGLAILFLSFAVAVIFLQKLLKPIIDLARKAMLVSNGNYQVRAITTSNDEIGSLCKEFNQMVETIEDNIYNLDQKVKEKTRELEQSKNELKVLASTDPLTGIFNRRSFIDFSQHMLGQAKREKFAISLLMLDIDKFKRINDTWGHDVGDQVLKTLTSTLEGLLRKNDLVCRYGGEEFVVLLPRTPLSGASVIADKIRQAIAQKGYKLSNGEMIYFSVSIGVTEVDVVNEIHLNLALKRSDIALYQAKAQGRNRVILN